uniref:Trehalase n=1 Tax=Amphilophus citrinellus TaxID=61819 RepID=A0A3Q0TFW8_AMPCI
MLQTLTRRRLCCRSLTSQLNMWKLGVFCCLFLALFASVQGAVPPPCDSDIYCTGPILHQVQEAKLFDDDKHFVDMKLRSAPGDVLSAFRNLSSKFPNTTVSPAQLYEFLNVSFEEPGTEFESWTPPDWHEKPHFLAGIVDDKLRVWAEEIHGLWKSLGRKVMIDTPSDPHLRAMDSYWVINGLLLSEMTDTARGMIQNLLYLVNRYGFVPNGGRIYYERRSQPPFLTLMVESYYQATKDKEFLRAALPVLEVEYRFWMQNRSVALEAKGKEHVLNRYYVEVGLPRPESYTDDVELAEGLTDGKKEQLWMDLKAGAESGWDFSSRWYVDDDDHNNGTLRDTRTSQILPADLNALLCRNEKTLASFHRVLGDSDSAAVYQQAAARRLEAIESVLWDAERGAWFDYNLVTHSKNLDFYPSNLAPVWAQCYSEPPQAEKAVQYLKGSGALQFPNGVPTSLRESGQQWDYPNAWPPLQHMLIDGLSRLPSEDAKKLSFDLAQRWIKTNWLAYIKYEHFGAHLGFGWTNGVALQLLHQYGATLTSGGRRVCSGLLLPLVVVSITLQ